MSKQPQEKAVVIPQLEEEPAVDEISEVLLLRAAKSITSKVNNYKAMFGDRDPREVTVEERVEQAEARVAEDPTKDPSKQAWYVGDLVKFMIEYELNKKEELQAEYDMMKMSKAVMDAVEQSEDPVGDVANLLP